MEDHTDNPPAKPRKPRRKRPHGRWTNPASPLQAARFAHKLSGKTVVVGIRTLCEGHGDEDCKIDVAKLSDYETRNRRPGLDHMTALCKFYQMSPEALGLIKWRDEPQPGIGAEGAEGAEPDGEASEEQLVVGWLVRSATAVAMTVMKAVAEYPAKPAPANVSPAAAAAATPEDHSEPPDEDPPPEPAGIS